MSAALDALGAFALLSVVFTPLERLFAAHRQRVLREEWSVDIAFFLGQYLLWTAPVVAVLVYLDRALEHAPLAGLREHVRSWPFALQFLVAILLSDASIYWAHRLSHRVPLLWRFHRVHHTAPRLDWLAAHREHPLDNLFTRVIENMPLIALGLPLHALAGFAMFRGMWALYIHSNVALNVGPLRYLIGSPRLHHWHHEPERGGRVNFANLSPLMDVAFGTFHDPGAYPARYGTVERVPHGYVAQLVGAFAPRAWAERIDERRRAWVAAARELVRQRRAALSAAARSSLRRSRGRPSL